MFFKDSMTLLFILERWSQTLYLLIKASENLYHHMKD